VDRSSNIGDALITGLLVAGTAIVPMASASVCPAIAYSPPAGSYRQHRGEFDFSRLRRPLVVRCGALVIERICFPTFVKS
jgi:hypothetical protein